MSDPKQVKDHTREADSIDQAVHKFSDSLRQSAASVAEFAEARQKLRLKASPNTKE